MHKINERGYVSFKESISDFFHGLIDFKGITTRRGYLFPMIYFYAILFTGCNLLLIFTLMNIDGLMVTIFEIIIATNVIVANLLIIPVTVRRFRDIGFNIVITILMLLFAIGICPLFGVLLPTDCFKKKA